VKKRIYFSYDLWYHYTAMCESVTVSLCESTFDTTLAVYEGTCSSLTEIACDDDACGVQSETTFSAQSGTTYYIRIGGYDEQGSGSMTITSHTNDDYDDAFIVSAVPYSTSQNTTIATTASDDPSVSCGSFTGQGCHSVWYQYTPQQNGLLNISAASSSYDPVVALWTGKRGSLELVTCDYENKTSAIQAPVLADILYIIEILSQDTGSCGETNVSVSLTTPIFSDVPQNYWARRFIEALYYSKITSGCAASPLKYCPDNYVTRSQMAIFLERGMRGSGYVPPLATGIFTDVDVSYWAAGWIEQLYNDGITRGCSNNPLKYCPNNAVTREQMAIFLLRAMYGENYVPPPATGSVFLDVNDDLWSAAWIEQLAAEGITGGCGEGYYCPGNPVTRAQMAVFLIRSFNLIMGEKVFELMPEQ